MQQYLDLLRSILERGVWKKTRTKSKKTGNPLDALSVFGYLLRFDLTAGFPAVTTKRLGFRTVAHELLWFLRGETNLKYLHENKVTIWDEWADEKGDLGPIYGKQWRAWQDEDGGTIDQMRRLLEGIEEVKKDPRASVGRRLIVSAWNVADLPKMRIAPCHVLAHFSVAEGRLSCLLYQRSADVFYGVPFNIASYALLTHLIAKITGLVPIELVHMLGDAHIYENQTDFVREQLTRTPYHLPRLDIASEVTDLFSWTVDQVRLEHYQSHPKLGDDDVAV